MSASKEFSTEYAHAAKDDGQGLEHTPGDGRASQLGGMSNFDCEAAVPLSGTGIQIVELARPLRIQFEPRQDSGRRLGSTRSNSLLRCHDRWDCGGRIGDRGLGVVVEGTQETSRALEDRVVGLRPRSCRGEKKSIHMKKIEYLK